MCIVPQQISDTVKCVNSTTGSDGVEPATQARYENLDAVLTDISGQAIEAIF